MKKLLLLCSLTLLVSLFMSEVYAQGSSPKISIQGILKSADGAAAADGDQIITFRLYDAMENGTEKWKEIDTVSVSGGIYSHLLGSETDLPTSVFGSTVYLELEIDGSTLSPRTELTYSPYTLSATGIAGNDGGASFNGDGNLVVAKANAATANVLVDGDISADGSVSAGGNITSDGTVSSVGNITSGADLWLGGSTNTGIDYISSTSLSLQANGTGVVNIVSGNVGIKTSPSGIELAVGDSNSGINYISSDKIALTGGGKDILTVDGVGSNRRVGINKTSPDVAFHVGSTGARQLGARPEGNWFKHTFADGAGTDDIEEGSFADNIGAYDNIVAIFEGDVVSTDAFSSVASYTFSDQRIKKNMVRTNSKEDLITLNKVQIKNYEHIDQRVEGTVKKVIAQELKKVYPNAISYTRNVVPNVYENSNKVSFADGVLTITTTKAHTFTKGDKVDVYTPKEEYKMSEVLAVKDAYTFSIAAEAIVAEVFVYGKYVDDFHVVDYDAIAMLNVSATQELYRLIQELQQENTALKAENTSLKTASTSLDSRLAKLEALLNVNTKNVATSNAASK